MTGRRYRVGDGGRTIWIDAGWKVLDVGSGQSPHPRADVLLEKYADENVHRAGRGINRHDPRLVIGDALDMPFADGTFDYAIASHVAEHVEDPAVLCHELVRVAEAGYLETPGWLGDMLLREDFHIWRVRRRGDGLVFHAVTERRPLGRLGDAFYALLYATTARAGHWTPNPRFGPLRVLLWTAARLSALIIRAPVVRPLFYMCFEWRGPFPVEVVGDPARQPEPIRVRGMLPRPPRVRTGTPAAPGADRDA